MRTNFEWDESLDEQGELRVLELDALWLALVCCSGNRMI
jgi:hypothetical protein